MSVTGKLSTMSLTDLLQWAAHNTTSGTLELERQKKVRRITFREGRIVACSADDPSNLLGQFLLSQGRIAHEDLLQALAHQKTSRQSLGAILIEMGKVTEDEVDQAISDKAEETIFGLFDWRDAVFRFEPHKAPDRYFIEVDFTVDEIMIRGLRRQDELRMIRRGFPSSGVVLERTDTPVPPDVEQVPMAGVLDLLDSEPTLAEVLLFSHASEFRVLQFLYRLFECGAVRIKEVREVDLELPTLLDGPDPASGEYVTPEITSRSSAGVDDLVELNRDLEPKGRTPVDLQAEIEVAERLMSRDDHEAALEVLNACYRAQPGELYVRHLIARAEAGYGERARSLRLAAHRVPVPCKSPEEVEREDLAPEAQFLLSLIDGAMEIESIVWLAPMREVDVFRTLERLLDQGLIELKEEEGGDETPSRDADARDDVPVV